MGKVYLTGAGPGDLELLTLKAHRIITQADVLIYDRLANPEILTLTKEGCEQIYVGKKSGRHTLAQEKINQLIYEKSLQNDTVVRLKGGDPFVFGRGGEEGIYLQKRGVAFEIIPGITSAISVPAYAGIPVTHREVARSFRVITGHRSTGALNPEIEWESFQGGDTLIFLMGLHNLKQISSKLIEIGKPKDLPCAVISKGTTREQKVVVATLENIAKKAKGLPTPALIIVGEVVKLHKQLAWFKDNIEA